MGWWVAEVYHNRGIAVVLSWAFWVIFSITLHELSHGWAALWQGDTTPRDLHRMTMNPWVHMGPWSLLMFALVGIAWGVMPVNPSRFRNRRWGDLYVAAAGPAMNIALALLCIIGLGLWLRYVPPNTGPQTNWVDHAREFFYIGALLNIVLATFNMLPMPPLDGSTVAKSLSPAYARFMADPQKQMIGFFFVLALLFLTPLFDWLFEGAAYLTITAAGNLVRVLP